MLTILHAADLHLDAPFASLAPEQARRRRAEQRELLERLAALARTQQADLVLLSGDLLDSGETYHETVQALSSALGRMEAQVFIAPGNHDFYSPRSIYAGTRWPENVHIFSTVQVESVELPALGCVVHGAAFTTPLADRSPLMGFSAPRDGRTHLMVLHGDVDGRGRYGPIRTEDIASSGLTYLALGHVHACSGLQRAGGTWWAYPGCPEGRGFDELGDKGVLAGEVSAAGVDLRFVPLCRRRYHIIPVDVTGREPREALAEALPETAAEDVCRFVLTGESGEQGVDLPSLETAFAQRCYVLQLRDQTRPAEDIWKRAGEDTLRGLFLQDLRRRWEAASDEEERQKIALAVRFGLAALDGRDL